LVQFRQYPYKVEDSQIVIVRKPKAPVRKDVQLDSETFILAREYADSFEKHKMIVYSYLKEYASKVGKVALYGAGHLAVMFVNSLQIEKFIEFVVDDTEQKQNLYLPGTSLQIKPSELLEKGKISLCILCLSVEFENKVMGKNHGFIAGGGVFLSSFPMQENSLFKIASKDCQI
jgi:hypothetical protein